MSENGENYSLNQIVLASIIFSFSFWIIWFAYEMDLEFDNLQGFNKFVEQNSPVL